MLKENRRTPLLSTLAHSAPSVEEGFGHALSQAFGMIDLAKEIALDVGALLKEGQEKGFRLDHKSSSIDLVTEYDRMAETLVVEALVKAFPDHGIVAEEGSCRECRSPDGYRWYVDPLDGTNNFAHRIPHFSVSIALYRHDQPELGVIYDPMRAELFWAQRGGGAFLNEKRLQVSAAARVEDAILASGFPYDRHHSDVDNLDQVRAYLKKCQGFRRLGSCALDLCYVAAGRYDGFWEFKLASWDLAAGLLLVSEAGGAVSRIDGAPIGYLTQRNHIVASNGRIHREMLEIVAPTLTPAHLETGDPVL